MYYVKNINILPLDKGLDTKADTLKLVVLNPVSRMDIVVLDSNFTVQLSEPVVT